MARGRKKDNPTHMAPDQIVDTLRRASSQMVDAEDALKSARAPLNSAKAAVKATGLDFDIFKLLHGIRHAEDDTKRQNRINKLKLGIDALLGDMVTLDLFGTAAPVAARPEVKEALQQASDDLRRAMPEGDQEDEDGEDDSEEAELEDADERPATDGEDDPPVQDLRPLAVADEMPGDAGSVFNAGVEAGRNGFLPEDNHYDPETPEHALWERGRIKGATQAAAEDAVEIAAAGFRFGVAPLEGSEILHAVKDLLAGEEVFRHPDPEFCTSCCVTLNAAQAAATEPLTPEQVREAVQPHLVGFGVHYQGRYAPAEYAEPAPAAEPAAKRSGRISAADGVKLYFVGFDGQKAGTDLAELVDGRSRGERKHISSGFEDALKGKSPSWVRPAQSVAVEADSEQPTDLQDLGAAGEDQDGENAAAAEVDAASTDAEVEPEAEDEDELGVVAVREKDAGGHELFDTRSGAAVIDCNGPRSGETWAGMICSHFVGREADVTHAELAEAGKTLALGRLLSAPAFTPAPSTTTDVFAAV